MNQDLWQITILAKNNKKLDIAQIFAKNKAFLSKNCVCKNSLLRLETTLATGTFKKCHRDCPMENLSPRPL